jgi:acetyl esterase/lipase
LTSGVIFSDNQSMQRIPIQDCGLAGALYLPEKQGPHPLIITLGGFRAGTNESRAEKLASSGFAALSLAYFGCPGLPSTIQEIPLEYFEKGIDWAARHPSIDPSRIALWGVSRGAELSLILGSTLSFKFSAIAATVPASAIYGSIQSSLPAWIYRGRAVGPSAPFPKPCLNGKIGQTPESALALTPYFLEGMKERAAFAASEIPVEKIQCPLFLVSGEDDQMWPSFVFAEQMMRRLQAKGSSISRVHVSYPRAGHGISSTEAIAELHPIAKIWFAFGGNPRDNERAKIDSLEKTVSFFHSWIS